MTSSRKTQSSTYSTDTPRPPSPVGYRPRIKAYTRNLTSAIQPKDRSHTQAQIENASNTVTNWGTGDRSHARCTPGFGGVSAEPNPAEPNPGPHQRPETARGAL